MSGSEWRDISREAVDLIKKMLTYDPKQRISAEQAINHAWILKKVKEPIDKKSTLAALTNLKGFRAEQKMQ